MSLYVDLYGDVDWDAPDSDTAGQFVGESPAYDALVVNASEPPVNTHG